MSHIVIIQTEVRDKTAVETACQRLKLPAPLAGRHELFSSQAEGLAVRLNEWRYPLVCQTETGQLHYDNYEGRWGQQQRLDEWLQAYAVEKTKLEARRQGYQAYERQLASGEIEITINAGGAA